MVLQVRLDGVVPLNWAGDAKVAGGYLRVGRPSSCGAQRSLPRLAARPKLLEGSVIRRRPFLPCSGVSVPVCGCPVYASSEAVRLLKARQASDRCGGFTLVYPAAALILASFCEHWSKYLPGRGCLIELPRWVVVSAPT